MPGAMLPTRCICGAEKSSRTILRDRCEEVEIRLEEEWEARRSAVDGCRPATSPHWSRRRGVRSPSQGASRSLKWRVRCDVCGWVGYRSARRPGAWVRGPARKLRGAARSPVQAASALSRWWAGRAATDPRGAGAGSAASAAGVGKLCIVPGCRPATGRCPGRRGAATVRMRHSPPFRWRRSSPWPASIADRVLPGGWPGSLGSVRELP